MYRQYVTLFMAPFWGLEFEVTTRFFFVENLCTCWCEVVESWPNVRNMQNGVKVLILFSEPLHPKKQHIVLVLMMALSMAH